MKKIMIGLSLSALLLLAGCASKNEQLDYIGLDAAKEAAVSSAGYTTDTVTFTTAELTEENGTECYEIEFTAGGETYEYYIDPLTGIVIESELPSSAADAAEETADTAESAAVSSSSGTADSSQSSSTAITAAEAEEIALSHAGLTAEEVTFVRAELDAEDGQTVYDVEFYTEDYSEYDYEISAETGEVLSCDYEAENYIPSGTTAAVSLEEAESAALEHAGLSADEVYYSMAHLDEEDGELVYEIEFYTDDSTEYEYEVSASTCEILSTSTESSAVSSTSGSGITAEEAKELALAQVPGATSDDIREFETDTEDGATVYEGTIVYGGMEYEFEIDAYSGSFLSWESEHEDDDHDHDHDYDD